MSYSLVKSLHIVMAIATIAGFTVRNYWMMARPDRLQTRAARILPHVIDTVFLLSGVALILQLNLDAFSQPWLLAKFAGLIIYVVLGTIAIKRGPTRQIRATAFIAALATFAYIVGVALSKSPTSWLALLAD